MKPSPTQCARGRGKMAFTPRMVGVLEVDEDDEVEDDDPMVAAGARSRRRRPRRWRMVKSVGKRLVFGDPFRNLTDKGFGT